ncbi:MAG TPA: glycogen/starch synthase [Acidimicrobiales bacterium]
MRVLFATAELSPVARVGGLAEASAGLTRALRDLGVDVNVVLPDYGDTLLADEHAFELAVPDWVGHARARHGVADGYGRVTLVSVAGMARPHPYLDPATGDGWLDNDARFLRFSAAVAALARTERPDLLHLNDWHTACVLGLLADPPPTVFTIHTLGYQGVASRGWLDVLVRARDAFAWYDSINPLAGAIRLADLVVAVSPNYAREVVTPAHGMGMHELLAALGDRLVGIRNGIDPEVWNPATDTRIAATYSAHDLRGKQSCRAALAAECGWPDDDDPIIGMVTRLAEQKGIDLALRMVRYLDTLPGRLVVLGAGDRTLARQLAEAAAAAPDRVAFREGYDDGFGHRIFAGSDLFLMPSRFEPCGLAQMQAMAYGTIPVVTDVGGLHDTVSDDDRRPGGGTGFVSCTVDTEGLVDALHRAVRALRQPERRGAIQRRGTIEDWSWRAPAEEHLRRYRSLLPA